MKKILISVLSVLGMIGAMATPVMASPAPQPVPGFAVGAHSAAKMAESGPVEIPELFRGDTGPFVVMLQALLNDEHMYAGHTKLVEDGVFGMATKKAVIKYQKSEADEGLRHDGIVDNDTWHSITTVD